MSICHFCSYNSRRKREAEPDPAENSDQEAVDSFEDSDNSISEAAVIVSKNQKMFNDAMSVVLELSFSSFD